MSSVEQEILNGLEEIRKYWDPYMSRDYFFRHVRPHLNSILFKRRYWPRLRENIPQYYTYRRLVLILKLRLEEKTR
jgi:hypothetical protein